MMKQIEKVKRKISRKVILTPTEEITTEEPKAYANLPYINGTTNILRIIVNEHTHQINVYFKRNITQNLISSKRQTLSRKEKQNCLANSLQRL